MQSTVRGGAGRRRGTKASETSRRPVLLPRNAAWEQSLEAQDRIK